MSWFGKKPDKPLRDQLAEARDNLIRQIAILDAGPAKNLPTETEYMRAQSAELRRSLSQIEEQMDAVGPEDA
jgi:hypothetical protein